MNLSGEIVEASGVNITQAADKRGMVGLTFIRQHGMARCRSWTVTMENRTDPLES